MNRCICIQRYRSLLLPFFSVYTMGGILIDTPEMCFSHLTRYLENHSLFVHRDLPHSLSQLPRAPLCEWTIHNLSSKHFPMYEHLHYFPYVKIINNAAINILLQMYFWYFQHWFLDVGLLSKNINAYVFVLNIVKFPFMSSVPIYILTSDEQILSGFAHSLPNKTYHQTLKFCPSESWKWHIL